VLPTNIATGKLPQKKPRIGVNSNPLGDPGNHRKPLPSLKYLDLHLFYHYVILVEIFNAAILIKIF
jgi:hypothetical protein